MFMLRE